MAGSGGRVGDDSLLPVDPGTMAASAVAAVAGFAALAHMLPPPIYPVSAAALCVIGFLNVVRGRLSGAVLASALAFLMLSSAWMLSSGASVLPRDDVYHYYPYMLYIYERGRLAPPNPGRWFEDVFLGTVAPWPLWPLTVAVLARVSGLGLVTALQASELYTAAPLILLGSAALAHTLSSWTGSRRAYILLLVLPFTSFYVFTATNPVSRSLAAALYLVIAYLLARIMSGGGAADYTALLIACSGIGLSHPYWGLATPLLLAAMAVALHVYGVLRGRAGLPFRATARRLLLVSMASAALSTTWVLYNTWTVKMTLIEDLRRLASTGFTDILGLRLLRPWAEMASAQHDFFSVNPLEPILSKLVWAGDMAPLLLSAPPLLAAVSAAVRGRRVPRHYSYPLLLAASGLVVALATGAVSSGLVTRYALLLVYVPACIAAAALLSRHGRLFKTAAPVVVALLAISSPLTLGTRSYQAAFTWGGVGFVERGMHSPYARAPAGFYNEFYNYSMLDAVYSDDQAYRVYMPLKAFIGLSERMETMPPASILSMPPAPRGEILVVEVRGFRPTYWMLKDEAWYGVNITERIHHVVGLVESGERIYDDGHARLYLLLEPRGVAG